MYGTREINIALYPPQRVLISPPQSFFSGLTSASFPIHRITMLSLTHILQNLIFHFFSLLAKCQKKKTSLLSIVLFSFYYIFLLSEIFDTTLPILCSSLKLYFFVDDILHKTNIS